MTATPSYLNGLTPDQHAAVTHGDGPLLVLAGAGSGKTRVLTSRIAHLVDARNVEPGRILAVTFTNKAAGEMQERLAHLIGESAAKQAWVGTFHRLGARLLRAHADRVGRSQRYTIVDPDEGTAIVKGIMKALFPDKDESEVGYTPKEIRNVISSAKNALVTPERYALTAEGRPRDSLGRLVAAIYPRYEQELARRDAFDLDDLIGRTVDLLQHHEDVRQRYATRFRYVLIDEYQDTNGAQDLLISLLAREHRNLTVVGDDDQAIYAFRGADVENILRFEHVYAPVTTVRLEQNYRSTPEILALANAVIAENEHRSGKVLHTENPSGHRPLVVDAPTDLAEAGFVVDRIAEAVLDGHASYQDIAILYRTNRQSRPFEQALLRRGIPYTIVGGLGFYQRAEIKDALAYLRVLLNPRDRTAFLRAAGTPKRGLGEKSLAVLGDYAVTHELSDLDALAMAEMIPGIPAAARGRMLDFHTQWTRWRELHESGARVRTILDAIVADVKWPEMYQDQGDEGRQRLDNLFELLVAVDEFDTMPVAAETEADPMLAAPTDPVARFLEHVALVASADAATADSAVTLMTVHAAKGLEFPYVFVTGMEEGLFPSLREGTAEEQRAALAEERRLCYVAMTRARQQLICTHAQTRRTYQGTSNQEISSFLCGLPHRVFDRVSAVPMQDDMRAPGMAARRDRIERDIRRAEHAASRLPYERTADDRTTVVPAAATRAPGSSPALPAINTPATHATFGAGTVVAHLPLPDDPHVVVDFPGHGRRAMSLKRSGVSFT